ncbi:MAG: DUF3261 domain-containing protein [bacterium]|nr:DUF3261 domain-containing protein [bacterium]
MRRLLCGLGLLWLLAACSHPMPPEPVPLSRGASFELMPPASYGADLAVQHQVTLIQADQERQWVVLLEIEGDQLAMAALGPMGQPLLSLTWGPEGLSEQSPLPLPVEGRFVLADLQLALWPHLSGLKGLHLEESATERRFFSAQKELIRITYYPQRVGFKWLQIQHFERNYRLKITALD